MKIECSLIVLQCSWAYYFYFVLFFIVCFMLFHLFVWYTLFIILIICLFCFLLVTNFFSFSFFYLYFCFCLLSWFIKKKTMTMVQIWDLRMSPSTFQLCQLCIARIYLSRFMFKQLLDNQSWRSLHFQLLSLPFNMLHLLVCCIHQGHHNNLRMLRYDKIFMLSK